MGVHLAAQIQRERTLGRSRNVLLVQRDRRAYDGHKQHAEREAVGAGDIGGGKRLIEKDLEKLTLSRSC